MKYLAHAISFIFGILASWLIFLGYAVHFQEEAKAPAQEEIKSHLPTPPNPNCLCGCTQTGNCTCKDCDHPCIVKPATPEPPLKTVERSLTAPAVVDHWQGTLQTDFDAKTVSLISNGQKYALKLNQGVDTAPFLQKGMTVNVYGTKDGNTIHVIKVLRVLREEP